MYLSAQQIEQLLKPINPRRVASRRGGGGKSLSYVEAYDIKAHMIRIFGFTGWSWDVIAADLVFEEKGDRNWEVGYRVIGRLTVGNGDYMSATYTEAAVGIAALPSRGEAHDMAVKTGESDAFKRAAINLGDQFGLSLYNNGSTNAVVQMTLAANVSVPVEMDETIAAVTPTEDSEPAEAVTEAPETPTVEDTPGADIIIGALREAMSDGDVAKIVEIKQQAARDDALEWVYDGKTIGKMIDLAVVHAGKVKAGRESLGGEEVQA